jgi:glycosyltransferase involved in cell wall biosynthesis
MIAPIAPSSSRHARSVAPTGAHVPGASAPSVLLFTDADVFAGTERHILDLADGLRSQAVRVQVACPKPSPLAAKVEALGINVIAIPKRGLIDRSAARQLRQLLRDGAIDLIHSHNGRTSLIAAMAVRSAKKGHCIATQHFLEPNHVTQKGIKGVMYRMAHHWVAARTAHFIAISQAACDGMLTRREAPGSKITVVPNGIPDPDLSLLRPVDQVRAELGIADGQPLVVCAARLEKEKDIATLIAAMKVVHQGRPDCVCVVAGEGSLQAELDRTIASEKLSNVVKLLGFRSDVMSLIAAGDLFVLPSPAEPFGLVILEAMALGRAVVATKAGGPLEIVKDGETGVLTTPSDPASMASAIVSLIADDHRRHALGAAGRQRFEACFTVNRMARAIAHIYQRTLRD